MSETTMVLAHQGGWDEILMVLGPLAILFVVLLLANRRARNLGEARRGSGEDAVGADATAEPTTLD